VRVLLDANVLVAAFATRGLCEAVFEVCLDSHDIVMGDDLLQEVAESLRDKFRVPDGTVEAIVRLLQTHSQTHIPSTIDDSACRDPKDLHVLGLASAAGADCIITGDKDFLTLGTFESCRILSPRQFSDLIRTASGQQEAGRGG